MAQPKLGLVVMVGAASAPGLSVGLVQEARQAAVVDTLQAAQDTGLFDCLVVVTNDPGWACTLPLECVVDLDDTRHPFHFGRRLAGVIEHYGLSHVLYSGAGAAPLMGQAEMSEIAHAILSAEALVVTNNLHSSDWVAFTPGSALSGLVDRVERDNALAWVLHREANLPAETLPPTALSRLDIDTPTDLLVLALHPGCGSHLAERLATMPLDTGPLEEALGVLTQDGKHVIVAGRVGSTTWAALERETQCWVRMFAEERGMVASGRQGNGQVRSLLGAHMDAIGMERFFHTLADWADTVFWDNRVVMAHRGLWPSAQDRFASDLGWIDQIREPFVRDLTRYARSAPIPIVMGGHSLVSGGMLALLDVLKNRES